MSSGCAADVLLLLPGAALLHSGLLTAAVLLGACFGLLTSTLIHTFILKPALLNKKCKGYDPWSLFEVEQREEETESSIGRRTAPSEPVKQAEGVSSDVAAFALKAKVIYPINQRYRPLADGASNPSLHENLPNPPSPPDPDSASSSSEDWPSEEGEREGDESSLDSCSGTAARTQQNLFTFRKVQYHPQMLCYTDVEGKLSLLCVTLQDFHQKTTRLLQEKWNILLQIMKAVFSREISLHPQLQQLQKEVEQLKKQACPELLKSEKGAEPGSVFCSIEEVEKAGREKLEQILHATLSFAKRWKQLYHCIHSNTQHDMAQEMMGSLVHCLLLVEEQLTVIQTSIIKTLCDRLQWWEELSDWLRIKMALLRQEAELRVRLTTQSLEELTGNGQLGFDQMETVINELQSTVSDELQHCVKEVQQQTQELISEHCRKLELKMKKMMKAQVKEWSQALESNDNQQRDAEMLTQSLVELQVKQWKQRTDLQLQQDRRQSDSVCELWKKLFDDFSRRFTDLWRDCVVSALTTSSSLSVNDRHTLLEITELTLTNQIQQEENHTQQNLHLLRERQERDGQVWVEEEALAQARLKHLVDQHLIVTVATVAGQRDIQDRHVIVEKQRLLVAEIQRILAARHFYIHTVKMMKLALGSQTDTQNLQQEHLSELENAYELLQGHAHFLIGHSLVHNTKKQLVDCAAGDAATVTDRQKERLMECVCESVIPDSATALIQNYYARMHNAVTATQPIPPQQHTKLRERPRDRAERERALQKELNNWARKPLSVHFYNRVEQQKWRCLSQCEEREKEDEGRNEERTESMDIQQHTNTITQQLREEEDIFLSRLAALARVPLMDTQATTSTGYSGAESSALLLKTGTREGSTHSTNIYRYHHYH